MSIQRRRWDLTKERLWRLAILYCAMASAKSNQVEPFAYVRDLLIRFSGGGPDDLSELLPDQWLKKHPESRRRWSQ